MTNPIVVEKSIKRFMSACRSLWAVVTRQAGLVFFHARENLNKGAIIACLGVVVLFGQCYAADSVDQTAQKLASADRKVMFAAINSLAALNQADADLQLKNFYSTVSENYVKMQVLQAVAANNSPSARAIIRLGLKDANEYVRKAAVQALSFAPDEKEAVKALTDTLNTEKNDSVRGHALTALSNFSSTSAVAAISTELGDKTRGKEHRLRAAQSLRRIGGKQAKAALDKAKNDPQISKEIDAMNKAGK